MTELFLIRHEDAEPGHDIPDAHRGLTAFGRRRMRRTGALFAEKEGALDVIFTSPLVRAVQTSEILAAAFAHDEPILARAMVAEPPTVDAFLSVIQDAGGRAGKVAIVGHEPTLSYVAAELLGLTRLPLPFSKGMVFALDWDGNDDATFRYAILGDGPELVEEL